MTEILILVVLASFSGTLYAIVLRGRAEGYLTAPDDQLPGARGEKEAQAHVLLMRARQWYRASQGVFWAWAALVFLMYVVEASRGREPWGVPLGCAFVLAGGLLFQGDDIGKPTRRVSRGLADGFGYALRPVRNRVAAFLSALGLLIAFISAG